jgi:hypothetical protein
MSDTTYFQLIVWDCPPGERAALAAAVTDIGGKGSWDLVDRHAGTGPRYGPGRSATASCRGGSTSKRCAAARPPMSTPMR